MSYSCFLAGLSFRPIDAKAAANELIEGDQLNLVREPTNRFDENAIQVHTLNGDFIGYIAKDLAATLAPMIDNGVNFICRVGIRVSATKFELIVSDDE